MKSIYWPGTNIPMSQGNAFTARPASGFDTPGERMRAAKQQAGQAGRGGHAAKTMGNLSRRAQLQLSQAPASISIAPRGSNQGARIRRGGI